MTSVQIPPPPAGVSDWLSYRTINIQTVNDSREGKKKQAFQPCTKSRPKPTIPRELGLLPPQPPPKKEETRRGADHYSVTGEGGSVLIPLHLSHRRSRILMSRCSHYGLSPARRPFFLLVTQNLRFGFSPYNWSEWVYQFRSVNHCPTTPHHYSLPQ